VPIDNLRRQKSEIDVKERNEQFKFSMNGLGKKPGFQMPKVIKATSDAIEHLQLKPQQSDESAKPTDEDA